jgi:hypothetical protein
MADSSEAQAVCCGHTDACQCAAQVYTVCGPSWLYWWAGRADGLLAASSKRIMFKLTHADRHTRLKDAYAMLATDAHSILRFIHAR